MEVGGGNKRVEREYEDRISYLPDHLQDQIVNGLPIDEAVRMSCLSKLWAIARCWKRTQILNFDKRFCKKYIFEKNVRYGDIISSVLTRIDGPVKEFSLVIPYRMCDAALDITEWIRLLCEKGIEKLTIENNLKEIHMIPSHIYRCSDITSLNIRHCIFEQWPQNFEGFKKLRSLCMHGEEIDSELLNVLVSNAPKLEHLDLLFGEEGGMIVCDLPKLTEFNYHCHYCSRPVYLKQISNVTAASLMTELNMPLPYPSLSKLDQLVNLLPKVTKLTLNGAALDSISVYNVPEKLTGEFSKLRELSLGPIDIRSEHLLSVSLCIINSSPNLRIVEFNVDDVEPAFDHDREDALRYLEAQPEDFFNTPEVKFGGLTGKSFEILFLKSVVDRCKRLQTVWLKSEEFLKRKREVRLIKEVIKKVKCPEWVKIEFDPVHKSSLERARLELASEQ